MTRLAPIAKSLVAAGVAFTGAGATAAADGTITPAEWWVVAGATLVALAAVWRVPNGSAGADAD